ncbi:LuxR C-terminal-related transcriptional regulator [Streptomyces sp. NPDC088197]|uniref:helix-turn-helix transcriptional regulator n=1 Tax=unclassified Streptomyces TaxID=2593676 RepID=UPI0036EB0483
MSERPFEALGLSADADRAYPLLVATRGVADAELARQMGVSRARAEEACGELAGRGLAKLGRDGRWYPVPPQSTLLPLVSRAQEQLRRGRELLDRLGVEYQRVHEGHRAEEIVRVVEGQAAIGRWAEQLHASAVSELMAFVRTDKDTADDTVPDPLACGSAAVPGIRRRVVFERAGLESMGLDPLAALDPPGTRQQAFVRVTDRLPVRLCVADHSLALLPLPADARPPDPVMLVIRPSGLLDALVTLFESVWADAVPLGRPDAGPSPARADAGPARSAVQLRILAMLVSGSTDAAMARALGVAVRTVQRHIAAMQRDAGVDNRIRLVWHAARHGWLDDGYGRGEVVPSG